MFKKYIRKGMVEARPYVDGEDLTGISLSEADKQLPTLVGGMIARNTENPNDQWYIAEAFFKDNYDPIYN